MVLNSFKHTNDLIETMNNREARAAEVPAGNGVTDAASLARMYAAMIGEVDGVRLLKPETIEKARTLRTGAMVPPGDFAKLQFGAPVQYGLGYEFAREVNPMLGKGSFGHAGAGGRLGFAHPEAARPPPTSPTPCSPSPNAPRPPLDLDGRTAESRGLSGAARFLTAKHTKHAKGSEENSARGGQSRPLGVLGVLGGHKTGSPLARG